MSSLQKSIIEDTLLDISNENVEDLPWAKKFMEEVLASNRQAGLRFCQTIEKIGISEPEERKLYTSIFLNGVQERLEELQLYMKSATEQLLDRIEKSLQSIEQNCRLLQVEMPTYNDNEGKSLLELCEYLSKEKIHFHRSVDERREQILELEKEQHLLCKVLGKTPKKVPHDPLPENNDLEAFKNHIQKLQSIKIEREELFKKLKCEICNIVAELKAPPTLDFERKILQLKNDDVLITDYDMNNMDNYLKRLKTNLHNVREEIGELQLKIESLWNTLEICLSDRNNFMKKIVGNNYESLDLLKTELSRLEELKKENIKFFVDKLRLQLLQVWQQCHLNIDQQKSEFFAFSSDLYNEDVLELHERTLQKWQEYFIDNKDLLQLLKKHKELWGKFQKLQKNSDAANRYKNRGGRLLDEERTRNMCKKKMPDLEKQMRQKARDFEAAERQPFLTFGLTVDEYLEKIHKDLVEVRNKKNE